MKKIIPCLFFIFLLACKRDEVPAGLSVEFTLPRLSTLEITICRARLTGPANFDTSGFVYRWDWDNDKTWDTRYSAVPFIAKSFAEPGEFEVAVEALSDKGIKLSATGLLVVSQGYSAPKPDFRIVPDSGNFKTVFTFDAGLTRDAEEEAGLLTYSWDFNNDQRIDFVGKGNPIATHQFSAEGTYQVSLLVMDTSKLSGQIKKELTVNRIDTLIVPVIRIEPEYPSDLDTVHIFAGNSFFNGQPGTQLKYSFRQFRGAWTEPSENPVFLWIRPANGTYLFWLRVYSPENLYNEITFEVVVSRSNRKPTARITRNIRFGNILSVFEFDAWGSSDPENVPSELQARWDFEGDGQWDTPFDYPKRIRRVYTVPGIYQVLVEIMDPEGLKDMAKTDVHVSRFSNPTSQIRDVRDEQLYGIVKIGDQWWMGENLNWLPTRVDYPGRVTWMCYEDNPLLCEVTGKLYYARAISEYFTAGTEDRNLCPRGWHLPSSDEWLELIREVGSESAGTSLFYGGSSDFNILLGGYAAYFIYGGYEEFEMDSIYRVANFMTTTISNTALTLQYKRNESTVQFRPMPADGYYSVRCVRDE